MKKYLIIVLALAIYSCKPEVKETGKYNELIALGEKFARADQVDSAMKYFQEASKLDSTKFEVLYGLAFCYSKKCTEQKNHCPEAELYLDKALKMNPDHES